MKELIKRLAAAWGPPGREDDIRSLIAAELAGYVDEIRTDALGNLLAVRRPGVAGVRRVLVAAHMDTPGGIVTEVGPAGLLRFATVGSWPDSALRGQAVRFRSGRLGVIGGDGQGEIEAARCWIDAGAVADGTGAATTGAATSGADAAGADAAAAPVQAGDFFVAEPALIDLGPRLAGPGLGTRAACAALVALAQAGDHQAVELVLTFTVQGAVAPRGLRTAAYQAEPHLGVVVAGIPATPGPPATGQGAGGGGARLGGGPALVLRERGWVLRPAGRQALAAAATAAGVSFQPAVVDQEGPTSSAATLETSRSGVVTAQLGLPVRGHGSPREIVDVADVAAAVRWLAALVSNSMN